MASNINLSYFGPPEQKCACKVPPMQTLAEAVEAVSSKFKPALAAGSYELQLNKKAVDLNTPFRLLNVPAGSKLEIIRREAASHASTTPQQAAQDLQAPPAMQLASAEPQRARPSEQQKVSQAALPSMDAPAGHSAGITPQPAAAAAAANVHRDANTAGAATTSSTQQPPASDKSSCSAAAVADNAAPAAAVDNAARGRQSAAAGAGDDAPASTSSLAALGVSRPVYVFHQRALEAAASTTSSAMEVDPPDDFFEMTLEDLARLQQQAAAKKKHAATFRTQAVRDAEAAARASSLGPVRVRLHFPDGTLLQATFSATDPLDKVLELLHKVSAPDVAAALYLYTTPPKTVLKDMSATLYQLQLIPAAHIYIGCDDKKLVGKKVSSSSSSTDGNCASQQGVSGSGTISGAASWLRPEVLALMQDSVPQLAPTAAAGGDDPPGAGGSSSGEPQTVAAAMEAQRALRLAAAAGRQAAGGSSAAGGSGAAGKVPKWMKIGKN